MYALNFANLLMIYVREWFKHDPQGLARLGRHEDPVRIMQAANAVFYEDARILMLNARYEIGQGLDSCLLFGDDAEDDDAAGFRVIGHVIAGRYRTKISAGIFAPTGAHPVVGTMEAHMRTLIDALPEGEVDEEIFKEKLLTTTLHTVAALTLHVDPIGRERVMFHYNPAVDGVEAARFLRQHAPTAERIVN